MDLRAFLGTLLEAESQMELLLFKLGILFHLLLKIIPHLVDFLRLRLDHLIFLIHLFG